jgi:hypothetical protein
MRTLLVSFILVLFFGIQLYRGPAAKTIIDGDGSGYYAYLPTIFHYKTTDFKAVHEFEKQQKSLSYSGHYFHKRGDVLINKYFLGTALAISPFYLLASLYSYVFGMPADGYNILYQLAVALAAAFYLALGLLAVIRLLRQFGFEKYIAFMVILLLLFGTNLFYYALMHPSHSHVYSFAAVSVFLMYTRTFFLTRKSSYFLYASIALGMLALIRPTNLLIIGAVPFIAGDRETLMKGIDFIRKKYWKLLFGIALFALIFGIQFIFNYIQTGNCFIWSYKNEGFDFLHPHIGKFLFGFKKGFFIYTPLMLAIIPGFYLLFRKSRFAFYSVFGFILMAIFILSSWWNWFYGDSFGMRSMIDLYPVLAILLAYSIDKLVSKRPGFVIYLVAGFLLSSLNLVQIYQYNKGIIHHDSMDFDKYKYVFLRTGNHYADVIGGDSEPLYTNPTPIEGFTFVNTLESQSSDWTQNGLIETSEAFSGKHAALMNTKNEFSPTLVLNQSKLINTNTTVYVKSTIKYNPMEPFSGNKAMLVYAATDKTNSVVFYKTFKLAPLPGMKTNTWHTADFGFKVPAWNADLAQVKVYVWNPAGDSFLIDDLAIEFLLTNETP